MASILKTDKIEGVTASGTVQMPAGHVIQVVSNTYTTEQNMSSSTFADTGLTATITPKFSTSKILILVSAEVFIADGQGRFNLCRGTTSLIEQFIGDGEGSDSYDHLHVSHLDSPSTTSATTYKTQQRTNGGASVGTNSPIGGSSMTLMEIAQ
tara:strand:+ start:1801 stop:2259 length:459 start_codon:yes stop_codon:yes gene_type:complete